MASGNFDCPKLEIRLSLKFMQTFDSQHTFPAQGQLSQEKGDAFCIRCPVVHKNWLPMRTILLDRSKQDNEQIHKQSKGILRTEVKECNSEGLYQKLYLPE